MLYKIIFLLQAFSFLCISSSGLALMIGLLNAYSKFGLTPGLALLFVAAVGLSSSIGLTFGPGRRFPLYSQWRTSWKLEVRVLVILAPRRRRFVSILNRDAPNSLILATNHQNYC